MKIAVSSKGAGLGAWLEPDFSKCGFMMVVDEDYSFVAIENNSDEMDLAEKTIAEGANALIVGKIKPPTQEFLQENDITVYIVQEGCILELVDRLSEGKFRKLE